MTENQQPDRRVIQDLFFEWEAGHNPEQAFSQYFTDNSGYEYDEINWGLISREVRFSREFMDNVAHEEASEMSDSEIDEYKIPEHAPKHPQHPYK